MFRIVDTYTCPKIPDDEIDFTCQLHSAPILFLLLLLLSAHIHTELK